MLHLPFRLEEYGAIFGAMVQYGGLKGPRPRPWPRFHELPLWLYWVDL
jgi:hypothetical protein